MCGMNPPGAATGPYEAVIFDMDGVVTDTANLHAAAWKELFDDFLAEWGAQHGEQLAPFDADADYRRYVDGRSREDGVIAFFASRGIALQRRSDPGDSNESSVEDLAERKNEMFLELLGKRGAKAFPSTVDLLRRLRAGGVQTALVSASRNAGDVLTAAGVADLFEVRVDGSDAASLGLPSKPDPAMFLEAARRLGVDPSKAAVVEDAVAGVDAARRGGFGLVVGVDRSGHRPDLEAAGADLVVNDIGELDLGAIRTDPMLLVYVGFDPAHEAHREALTTVGNGYVATRGAGPEATADGVRYPGTYLAGVYNRLVSVIDGRSVEDEHLVNATNWLPFDLRIEDGEWWSAGGIRVLSERRELDLRTAILTRIASLVDPEGRRLRVRQRRLVSMARAHLAVLETEIVAENWEGRVEVRTGLDGRIVNDNVAEYRALAKRHLEPREAGADGPEVIAVEMETSQSHIRIAQAARTTITGIAHAPTRSVVASPGYVAQNFHIPLRQGTSVIVEKVVAIATSRDRAISSPRVTALAELGNAGNFEDILADHQSAWDRLWQRFEVAIDTNDGTSLVLNLHVFHLLQVLTPHIAQLDAGVTARGLHGEGYRGHVFWDELFVFPVLNLRLPVLARALLDYRWRRLDEARAAARTAGLKGALFPWQSGSDGSEETPSQFFNPRSGRWVVDRSRFQRHVGLAIAYNAWQHYQVTGDIGFLIERGAELIIEVARLFASLATYDAADDRWDVAGVMGPDEYHDGYAGVAEPGLRNNTYTNVLAAWVLERSLEVVSLLEKHHCGDLFERLALHPTEPEKWEHVGRRLRIPFHDGVISQFERYGELDELDWERYRSIYGNIGRLDLILEAEGDNTNRYKLAKQADVLMLLYLFSPEEIESLLAHLGYPLESGWPARIAEYYLARTAHGSTLSRVVHAWALARTDRRRSWEIFRDALRADLDDTQGGTTGEGIHLGAMAGTLDLAVRCYTGITTSGDILWFDPRLPLEFGAIRFEIYYRGHRLGIDLSAARLRIRLHACAAAAIQIGVAGEIREVGAGDVLDIPIRPSA